MLAKLAVFDLLLVNKPAYRQAGATVEMGVEIVAKINKGKKPVLKIFQPLKTIFLKPS